MSGPLYGGCVSYFTFDDVSEPHDDTLYGNDGIFTDSGVVAGGIIGSAMQNSAADGNLSVATMPWLLAPTPQISVSVWVQPSMAYASMWGGGNPMFVDKRNGTPSGYALGVLTGPSNDVSFQVHNAAGTPYTATFTETDFSGDWINYVGTYAGATVSLYRNGTLVATAAADGTFAENTVDPMVIGLGLQGLLDEFALWRRVLDTGDVTALYNSGAGQSIVFPQVNAASDLLEATEYDYFSPAYPIEDEGVVLPPDPTTPDEVPFTPTIYSGTDETYDYFADPYPVIDSPQRIFVDPDPVITSISVDDSFNITGEGTGGPTDALIVNTWWEIELAEGVVTIVADLTTVTGYYNTRVTRTDEWSIPLGQDWQNLFATFVMQAAADTSQTWRSTPVQLTGAGYNNSNSAGPPPLPPLPPGPPLGPQQGPTQGLIGTGVARLRVRDLSRRSN